MKQLILAMVATLAVGSAAAQSPAKPADVTIRAEAGAVQVEGGAAIPLNTSAPAMAGDTISVSQGKATVTFADGCVINVVGAYRVEAVSPCKAGVVGATGPNSNNHAKAVGFGAAALVGMFIAGGGGGDRPSSP